MARPCSGGPESVTSPCPGVPVAGARVDLELAGSGTLIVATSDAAGRYSSEVPAGDYAVTVEGRDFYIDRQARAVKVTAGSRTTLDLVVDSGLR